MKHNSSKSSLQQGVDPLPFMNLKFLIGQIRVRWENAHVLDVLIKIDYKCERACVRNVVKILSSHFNLTLSLYKTEIKGHGG